MQIQKIFDDIGECKTIISPLSWNDQVDKNNIKLLSARKITEKVVEVSQSDPPISASPHLHFISHSFRYRNQRMIVKYLLKN